ncbi:complex I intermediate-associated protein 30-domain-containing protein [Sphaerosporella brunnea]|uniref:Complex I intermediate-associated protein 30-domain-containing protein n=1 Tax=Sphaerosporella brunnea TaxID=1250544 RepID=A0A5J5EZE0_9PEZI|nr:complex I intermediate-associated protein 30-domain-containing protein [Sphaerosporella brunnea]
MTASDHGGVELGLGIDTHVPTSSALGHLVRSGANAHPQVSPTQPSPTTPHTTIATMSPPRHTIFPPWCPADWQPQNDSLRGGSSTSDLIVAGHGNSAIFFGALDSKTLGGAGFASVRTTCIQNWDWRGYSGIELGIREHLINNPKKYTLVLKNELPYDDEHHSPTDWKKMETSTVSFEYTFTAPHKSDRDVEIIFLPFSEFVAYYRGRKVEPPPELDLGHVRRMSFMVRSFFGDKEQEGPFSLEIFSLAVVKEGG